MLQSLHVKNLALIDETEVEFREGLNILSGETGAGKSIIIGSINLALGEKIPKEMVRNPEKSAFVELIFHVEKEKIKKQLLDFGVELEENQVVLSRKITGGRTISRINGETVSVSRMKEISSLLIDIHGQHEHQSLLAKRKHLDILDNYAKKKIGNKKTGLAEAYQNYRTCKEEWEHSNLNIEERRREFSFLEYEVKEIEQAHLSVGEDEQLEGDYRRFLNGKKIMEAAGSAYAGIAGDSGSASERIGYALKELSAIAEYDPVIANLEQQLLDIDSLLSDFIHELSGYISDTDFDENNFYEIEQRINLINRLKSKYGDSIPEILKQLEMKQQRLDVLSDYDVYLEQLEKKLKDSEKELLGYCEEVSAIRQGEAKKLTKKIKDALKELNFLDVEFSMDFSKTAHYTANGYDDVQFMISTNPGSPLKPLDRVASGGELSRIMLAIKEVMADGDEIETLIFDEIDTGISGRTAQMVSEKMNVIARNHQIICITHLPQIAAMADAHFLIEKSVQDQTTISNIFEMSQEESVRELARMLGGVEITDTVLQSAQEMKELAATKK